MQTSIPSHYFDKIGKTYHGITIIDLKLQNGNVKAIYRCKCESISQCNIAALSTMCKKCYNKEPKKFKHGACRRKQRMSEYVSWDSMKQRCTNPRSKAYHNYGGRGISICKRWLGEDGFTNFLKDMGEKPEPKMKYSLERIKNNGNYSPSNCKWATQQEQLNNKRSNRETYPIYTKQCVVCKINYTGFWKNLYCSRGCQMKAYRARKLNKLLPPHHQVEFL